MTGQIYRIGRGTPPEPVNVSFDPADHRRCQNLLTWFERGGEPGATLLIDDWKLCAASHPGLADSVRWIAATARNAQVIIRAGALSDVPTGLRSLVRLNFLALHGLSTFTRALAWKGRWWKVPIGLDSNGEPVVVELTHFVDGKWRTGSHLSVTAPDAFRSLVLGLMTTQSPKMFQAIFIDAHDTDVFAGLDQAPHVQAHHRNAARNPGRLADVLLAESQRRLEVVGNTWTIFHHRGFDQVLPQLLVCVTGFEDIKAAEPSFASDLAIIAKDVGQSGMQLLLDCPHEAAELQIDDCTVPADLDEMAVSLPLLMHQDEPPPDFFTLHDMPNRFDQPHAWRPRPIAMQYRVAVGADVYGQPVEIDLKSSALQDGMGPHGEVVAPAERRAEALRALVLGQMLRHSPDELQVVLIALHGAAVFDGLADAPHVRAVDLLEDHEQRTRTLAANGYRSIWDYRAARSNGAELGPLPELLVCVDGLAEVPPEFLDVLRTLGQAGRTYGQHLLLSGPAPLGLDFLSYRLELTGQGWTRRISRSVENLVLPTDLDDVTRSLPGVMRAASS
ncbi:FtsK/SpoIIIE domain-containing protein [Lentzea sp. BCCO 10_0856]|uniref:FtsK/SpoIIIE domain-containing protein n=1 Tax=Lentzea miocenica TaxID=3095431 RepID=A0ABU4SVV6_9PSEU|nr:FtsK/SpoIIIE domain-containing protein [Lentzea sp. BCCO 10_0856]MDX8030031.1 FtsK/SpoIIIE domain-containing protein [Lentzea sp. BCCO 10_0856]